MRVKREPAPFAVQCLAAVACVVLASGLTAGRAAADSGPVRLPLELMGSTGASAEATFIVPDAAEAQKGARLWLRTHGLSFAGKGSIRLNGGPWVTLSNTTANVAEPGSLYGGIGGPLATLELTVPLADGLVKSGENCLQVRFNGTDGVSTGFRLLAFNVLGRGGEALIPADSFVQDDPAAWTPPLSTPADIAAGKQLWYGATLRASSLPNAGLLKARCTDCHAHDGRDLKYFNYSNYSIIERARFHGLSETNGKQIASYIRSLTGPAPGRPWNPPYQPGPALDSAPSEAWSAGAGLEHVLASDAETVRYMFPDGIQRAGVSRVGKLNLRELPVSLQLPDWNHWLPKVHPADAWGASFTSNAAASLYPAVRAKLGSIKNYGAVRSGFYVDQNNWNNAIRALLLTKRPDPKRDPEVDRTVNDPKWTPALADAIHSTRLWQLVKLWEMHQEFGLESRGPSVFGAVYGESRSWETLHIWQVAPFEQYVSRMAPVGISPLARNMVKTNYSASNLYFTNSWFYLQLILNSGSGEVGAPYTAGAQEYLNLHVNALSYFGVRQPVRNTASYVKYLQVRPSWDYRFDPYLTVGWSPQTTHPLQLGFNWGPSLWGELSAREQTTLFQALLDEWVDKNRDFHPSWYLRYDSGFDPARPLIYTKGWGYATYRLLGAAKASGVNTNTAVDWAKKVFYINPAGWEPFRP